MRKRTTLALALVGVALLTISSVSVFINIIAGAKHEVPFTTVDFVTRTGGHLMRPVSDGDEYPLGHDVYTPGNDSIDHIDEFREFSIYYQFILGFGILDNGSETDTLVPVIPGAEYCILMNLSTVIEIEVNETQEPLEVDSILNFYLNESTASRVVLPRSMSLSVNYGGTTAVLGYYDARTPNEDSRPTSELDLLERWVEIPFAVTLNLTLYTVWSVSFESPGMPALRYSGAGPVGRYLIHKSPESYASLDGLFRCHFRSTEVSVMASRAFLGELLLGAGGLAAVAVAAVWFRRAGDHHTVGNLDSLIRMWMS